jgi:predicted ATPase with chaperone activity
VSFVAQKKWREQVTITLDERLGSISEVSSASKEFHPEAPANLQEAGINEIFLINLVCKYLLTYGVLSGKEISNKVCLPFPMVEEQLHDLKQRLIVTYQSISGINDFIYALTEKGREKALQAREASAYLGSAPVPYADYLQSVAAQTIQNETPGPVELHRAFEELVLPEEFYTLLGPAINSGRGVFLYGPAGNGKTSIARRIPHCFTDTIFIPKTLLVEGQEVKFYDPQCHKAVDVEQSDKPADHDRRWLRVERPAVIVGGEMDMASMEIIYNPVTKVCEAPVQMKGNCGILVIDDFGRQRMTPEQLLNRWILPLEKRIDFLTLPNGIKFQVPFNALLIFCTNIDPEKLMDEAFLRRIPYKIYLGDPTEDDFVRILKNSSALYDVQYDDNATEYMLNTYFRNKHHLRSCYPRDILQQIVNISLYEQKKPEMTKEVIDLGVKLYFTATKSTVPTD